MLALILCSATAAAAQIPDEFKNLQFHPEDTTKGELINVMRNFSFALGVRCQYCHVGGDGVSFEGVEFDKDGPNKEKARFMLRMTENLNENILTGIPDRDQPALEIQCKTCHCGQSKPMLLIQEMRASLDSDGAEAAVARYRELRNDFERAGAFDFGEWEVNTLAEVLAEEGRPRDAIAIYELNAEFHADSSSIALSLGNFCEIVEDKDAAIRRYERALELRPNSERAQKRLEALRQ